MSGKILVVGLERDLFKKIDPLLNRTLFSVDRVPKGESGVLLSRQAPFDLIVVRHPLPDMSLGSLLHGVREPGSPCAAAELLVLTDDARLAEVRSVVPGGAKHVLSISEPGKLLQEVASRLLGVAPRVDTRVAVRLEVRLGEGRSLALCQSENISEGGMLLRTDQLLPVGTRVGFEAQLPGERAPIAGEAEVVRHASAEVEKVHGVGLKILSFQGNGQKRLRAHLARKTSA